MSKIRWHALSVNATLNKLSTNLHQGLTAPAVLERQKVYGSNQIKITANDTRLRRFFRQFHHTLVYILLASAAVSVYLASWVDASVILGVVVLNAIFGFFQEGKAGKKRSMRFGQCLLPMLK